MSKLVSVITPTWRRRELLLNRCIPSVLAQEYPNVEHVIVSDGPDQALYEAIIERYTDEIARGRIVFGQLPEHDPAARWGHHARLWGALVSRGEYLAWLDDDNAYRPEHLSRLVELLDGGAGFAYSQLLFHSMTGTHLVGAPAPTLGGIDTSAIAHRRELLDLATWRDEGQQTIDWDLVERWMQAGATWAHHPAVTGDYYFAGVGE